MSLKIFIDTEFTDFIRPKLISIGMVSEYGDTFYTEVPFPIEECSDFVREEVLPLLENDPDAMCRSDELRDRLIQWLESVRSPSEKIEICFDYQTDWDLFIHSLNYQVPTWCESRLVANQIDESLILEFHKKERLSEHHALYDAMANRYAFIKS